MEGWASHLKAVSATRVFILLIMTPELFPLLAPRRHDIASPYKDEPLQKRCQGGVAARCGRGSLTLLSALCPERVFPIRALFSPLPPNQSHSYAPITSGTVTEQKRKQGGIYWGGPGLRDSTFVAEDQHCWTAEGAGVNYSITGWLSLSCLNRSCPEGDYASLLAAKVTATTPSSTMSYCEFLSHSGEYSYICEGWGVRRGGGKGVGLEWISKRKKEI